MVKKMGKVKARFRKKQEFKKNNQHKAYINNLVNSIRKFDDPILSAKCSEISSFESKEKISKMVKDMRRVLAVTQYGIGLSAPQIGLTDRIIAYRDIEEKSRVYVMINPKIVWQNEKMEEDIESCMSYPGYTRKISRPISIELEYLTETGKQMKDKFEGLTARVICHEIDHLDGICLVGEEYKKTKEI